ncbi:Uncharacterized protein TCAP_04667 [Tolypocladium capitatum]|uniref:Uncharacterized protein n=1 Tax=Tolypocladium capitatum TaxID=45235 RepID=A0A2K3QCY3_9HYPO|nr:Uncharacterized protein TCAP_04667 [Tolypocladium capitatum]
MRPFMSSPGRSFLSTMVLLPSILVLQAWAQTTLSSASSTISSTNDLVRRAQAQGSECSSEGQWNCMTSSWQRCASGRWSVITACAAGTRCTPSGLTNDFRVEHDGSVNGGGGGSGGGGLSLGPKGPGGPPLLGIMTLFVGLGRRVLTDEVEIRNTAITLLMPAPRSSPAEAPADAQAQGRALAVMHR